MTCFKVDILRINELINEINKYKKEYYDAVVMNYNLLDNVDSCWNDANSVLFKNKIRNDRFKIFDYYSSFDDLCNKLNRFNVDLESVLSNFGFCSKTKLILKFDDSQLSDIKRRLSNTTYYLKEALYIVNNSLLYSDYKNMNSIYNLRRQINNAINNVETIKNNISKFVASINNVVEKYNNDIKEIDGLGLKLAEVTFDGNLVNLS